MTNEELIKQLRGASLCVYLATEKEQADHIAKLLREAAERLEASSLRPEGAAREESDGNA